MLHSLDFFGYASVILDSGFSELLDYGLTQEEYQLLSKGSQIEVELRSKLYKAYVIELKLTCSLNKVKPIHRIISKEPLISSKMFELALWISRYYCANLQEVIQLFLPPPIRKGMKDKEQLFISKIKTKEEIKTFCQQFRNKKPAQVSALDTLLPIQGGMFLTELLEIAKVSRQAVYELEKSGWIKLYPVKIGRSPLIHEEYFLTKPKSLNFDQKQSLEKILSTIQATQFHTHLLHGITGSGKTEIYLQAIEAALSLNKSAIVLVPEISLTTQMVDRFKSRFKEKIAILHYRLSAGERHDEWRRIYDGSAKVIIGARSAIFSPTSNLGLIIVDEEHDSSYKQSDRSPCYQARDVAIMRAKFEQATVVLGSATPSLESYYHAQTNKYTLSHLSARADNAMKLPEVLIVDMKKEKVKGQTIFSEILLKNIENRCEKNEQVILFLNRRGYHTNLVCLNCQEIVKCPHCDSSMTFHLKTNSLSCHLCGQTISPPPRECSHCKHEHPLKFRGVGTEQIERALHAIFPEIRTLRMDADTTTHKGSHQKILRQFATSKADVLIGTQMIAKGLDFSEVTLVGILNSDSSLHIPDFRSSEKTFQLLTQVAGRSGRGLSKGEVIIQTFLPENSTIQFAAKQDFIGFYKQEIELRHLFHYPPFCRLVKIVSRGKNSKEVLQQTDLMRKALIHELPSYFEFLPVVPCGHTKIKDEFGFQFLIKSPSLNRFPAALENIKKKNKLLRSLRFFVDVDPSSTFF